ncbi:MAG: protogloblin ApPgb [Deltaproteobacteria bacterium]|nr:MAG: protogloblin ApPgb [Deltaproteobacteria bacterium]
MTDARNIPGYTYGSPDLPPSPVSRETFEDLKKSVLFTEEDIHHLRMSKAVLEDQVEDILDVWYGFVGANPHLLRYFSSPKTGQPDSHYLDAVRKRFGQWILDTARAEYDDAWRAYQHEIGLRHHRTKKNRTDGADAAPYVPFCHLVALLYPITHTLRPFLAKKGHDPETVEKMHQAWTKSVLLQVILWSYPYVKEEDFQ